MYRDTGYLWRCERICSGSAEWLCVFEIDTVCERNVSEDNYGYRIAESGEILCIDKIGSYVNKIYLNVKDIAHD